MFNHLLSLIQSEPGEKGAEPVFSSHDGVCLLASEGAEGSAWNVYLLVLTRQDVGDTQVGQDHSAHVQDLQVTGHMLSCEIKQQQLQMVEDERISLWEVKH